MKKKKVRKEFVFEILGNICEVWLEVIKDRRTKKFRLYNGSVEWKSFPPTPEQEEILIEHGVPKIREWLSDIPDVCVLIRTLSGEYIGFNRDGRIVIEG